MDETDIETFAAEDTAGLVAPKPTITNVHDCRVLLVDDAQAPGRVS